jgi:hypothetical protein
MRPRTIALEAALLRGIASAAGLSQQTRLVIEELRTHDWSSATFIGARHAFDLRIEGEAAAVAAAIARLQAGLSEWEFSVPGHIVAEAVLESDPALGEPTAQPFTIRLLTIID